MINFYEVNTPEETMQLGMKMAAEASSGDIICLNGDLGCGKTVFTKGFAKGLGITEDVVSPTFTIVQEYSDGRLPLYHFDVYRIDDPDEMYEIGYEDYFFSDGVTLIEWSTLIAELIPDKAIKILIEKDLSKGVDYRKITVKKPDEYEVDRLRGGY